ncbi:MAG TPA: hypothetical protein DCX53_10275 [Anaerolineae bacterium]|nr:hypothetical protein [Anaerolineae bacterium]
MAVWIHFYQEDELSFSETGFKEYESLRIAFASAGLKQSLENDPKYPGRTILTPQMFNVQHSQPEQRTSRELLHTLSSLLCYVLIFLVPGFSIVLKLFSGSAMSITLKRILFVAISSLVLAPAPLPIIMFGPVFLLPLPFALPFALGSPPFLKLLAISVGCTAVLTSLISLLIQNPRPSRKVSGILP